MGKFGGNFPNYALKASEPPCHDALCLSKSALGSRRGQLGSVRAAFPPWLCQFGFDTGGWSSPRVVPSSPSGSGVPTELAVTPALMARAPLGFLPLLELLPSFPAIAVTPVMDFGSLLF